MSVSGKRTKVEETRKNRKAGKTRKVRKTGNVPESTLGNPNDPDGLVAYLNRHLDGLAIQNYSPETIRSRRYNLRLFLVWCDERSLTRPDEITRPILQSYQRYLYLYRKTNGEPLIFHTQHAYLVAVRGWFKWLARHNYILYNPASEIELPRLGMRLPQHVLTQPEVETVLNQTNTHDALGIRDRAILETLYSTGIRRAELINLKFDDIDFNQGTVMIRQGKGNKDRVVPISGCALKWIDKYLVEVRPELVSGMDERFLYLSKLSEPFTPARLTQLVRGYIKSASIKKTGSCHLFRHTMATLMLERGADLRFIQEILGHANMNSTQVYTRVSIVKLKEVHSATHPGAGLEKRQNKQEENKAEESESQKETLQAVLAAEFVEEPEA